MGEKSYWRSCGRVTARTAAQALLPVLALVATMATAGEYDMQQLTGALIVAATVIVAAPLHYVARDGKDVIGISRRRVPPEEQL